MKCFQYTVVYGDLFVQANKSKDSSSCFVVVVPKAHW